MKADHEQGQTKAQFVRQWHGQHEEQARQEGGSPLD
jgi:hypothetical protein